MEDAEIYVLKERWFFSEGGTFQFSCPASEWVPPEEGDMYAAPDGRILLFERGRWETIWLP